MRSESELRQYIPKRLFNRGDKTIEQASEIIHASAAHGLMWEHSPRELRRMARRGHLMMLVDEGGDGLTVVAVGGITQQHRRRNRFGIPGRITAAEFGALATNPDYGGNGYGKDITRAVAERYLRQGFLTGFIQSPDVRLFAMAAQNNNVSNGMFEKVGGVRIDQSLLPEAARENGYNAYDITSLGRRQS